MSDCNFDQSDCPFKDNCPHIDEEIIKAKKEARALFIVGELTILIGLGLFWWLLRT